MIRPSSGTSDIQKWVSLVVCDYATESADPVSWKLVNTRTHGRGICATRDISTDELIFSEVPLLHGPVVKDQFYLVCVSCYRPVIESDKCPNLCGLPICGSNCSRAALHLQECALLLSWRPKCGHQLTESVLKVLTAIRSLLLPDNKKQLLFALQANRVHKYEKCVDMALLHFQNPPGLKITNELKHITAILNTNAFQVINGCTGTVVGGKEISTKGLYALQGQLNHECVPNTRHTVNEDHITSVYAVKPIRKGDELTTTYTNILWSTPSRRGHLLLTKQFACKCLRCMDPTERCTYLAGIKCFLKTCNGGLLLPTEPIAMSCPWKCNLCGDLVSFSKICNIQEVLSKIVCSKIRDMPIAALMAEIQSDKGMLLRTLGATNQFIVEMKLQIIWKLNVSEGIVVI